MFAEIRKARPTILFIQADGPRPGRNEESKCEKTRRITEDVDWPCQVKRLYRDYNLGCRLAISGALDWFFSEVEEGVIIEDDCVPHPAFLNYAGSMLKRFRHDESVMNISGMGYAPSPKASEAPPSSFLLPFPFIWGWATWRRAWLKFSAELPATSAIRKTLSTLPLSKQARRYWQEKLTLTRDGEIDSWAYPWVYTNWVHGGQTIMPTVSLIRNTGISTDNATHPLVGTPPKYAPFWRHKGNWPQDAMIEQINPGTILAKIHRDIIRIDEHNPRHFLQNYPWAWHIYLGLRNRLK